MRSDIDASIMLEVFAATCPGCAKLERTIGLPVTCIKVASDATASIEAMNEAAYGGWTLWPDGLWPLVAEDGWSDWRVIPVGKLDALSRTIPHVEGRFSVDVPVNVSVAGFEAALAHEFRRLELREITTMARWVFEQSDAGRPIIVAPRYTLRDQKNGGVGASRVDNLFVIDPVQHAAIIVQAIARAKTSAVRIADEFLRHV